MLHVGGSCSMVPEQSKSSSGPTFGPWMAVIHRRRSTLEPVAVSRTLGLGVTDPALGLASAWQHPKRVARRQSRKTPVIGHWQSDKASAEGWSSPLSSLVLELGKEGAESGSGPSPACRFPPVPGTIAKSQTEAYLLNLKEAGPLDVNPFHALNAEQLVECTEPRMDSTPGLAKRARPVEPSAPRVLSKPSRAKGKATHADKGKEPASFTFSASIASGCGTGTLPRRGYKKPRSMTGITQLERVEGDEHEAAVIRLKQAIQDSGTRVVLDSSQSEDSSGLDPVECSTIVSDHGDEMMPGDKDGSLPMHVSG